MVQEKYGLLEQSYNGVQGHLYAITEEFNCRKFFRLNVISQSGKSQAPWIQLFPNPRRDERSFKVFIDVERQVWVCKDLFSDDDNLGIAPLPVSLSECVTVWLLGYILSSHQTSISDQLHGADIVRTRIDGVTYESSPTSDLGSKFLLWAISARILIDASKGELDDMFPTGASAVREIATAQLPSNAEAFWRWVEMDFDKDFSSMGKSNVEYIKNEFSQIGFPDGYEVDLFQAATDAGEALAVASLDAVMRVRRANQEAEESGRPRSKVLGWIVPLTVGLIIAIGAGLGY